MGSIRKGNPVIVCGVLGTEEWAGEDGEMHSRLVLEASNVGHDLNYVTTICRRMAKESTGEGNDERVQARAPETAPPAQSTAGGGTDHPHEEFTDEKPSF